MLRPLTGPSHPGTADLFSLTVQYQPRARLGFRLYSQFSDQWTGLTANPFFQRDKYLQSSVLCTYELVPTSFLYIGVNDERRRFAPPIISTDRLVGTGTRVFLKLSYLFQM